MSNISDEIEYHIECDYCDKWFKSVAEIDLHDIDEHLTIKCPNCVKLFRKDSELQVHVEHIHCVKCHFCGKSFESFEEMKYHDREVHLTIDCPHCNKLYRSDEQLQKHIEYKHKFQCGLCDKSFLSIEKLDEHDIYVHLTIECPSCDELLFRKEDDLLNHIGCEHSDLRCKDCSKWFYSQELKDFHMRQMHQMSINL
ncbi:zinc finger and BTB domain-containing protein 40-like [Diabrotica virgifera virgifera]|uniref:C2H2-type domain-containing protein n=1 Tax=Diabrotica virgifera virgifera TaxID=50390 RepID=A0ABM5KN17_DIAVI|nr:zinc finger and BTB domain-containing protein 40-like [Diabrotica virgifera virgifera]